MKLHFKTFLVVLVMAVLALTQESVAQNDSRSISQIESNINDTYGLQKLTDLNRLTAHYLAVNNRKAMRYGRQAVLLGERILDQENRPETATQLVIAYTLLGKAQYEREAYFDARRNFQAALELGAISGSVASLDEAGKRIAVIDSLVDEGEIKENFFNKKFGNLGVGKVVSNATLAANIDNEISQGQSKEKKGDYAGAIDDYSSAINLLRNVGDRERINSLQLKVAALQDSLGQYEVAQETLEAAIAEATREIEESHEAPVPDRDTSAIVMTDSAVAPPPPLVAERVQQEQDKEELKARADQLASQQDYEQSLEYYRLYQELSQQMYEDSVRDRVDLESREREIMLLSQQKEIVDLKLEAAAEERQKQLRVRNNLFFIALGILFACGIILYYYVSKRREHKKLVKAYDDLDRTKTQLENAEKRIVRLLAQQVSGDVAQELLSSESEESLGQRKFVCIMFLDIRDFTPMAETMSPEELIIYQNNVFSDMIDIVQQHHGNINQLLGDGFMATFGAPISHGNDCQNAFDAAQEILTVVKSKVDAGDIRPTRVGIGLHAGYVVTGNVGSEARKQYSITGNAVIVASRVEQLNKEYKSQLIITEDVYNQLEHPLKLNRPFIEVTVKGRTQPVKILKIA